MTWKKLSERKSQTKKNLDQIFLCSYFLIPWVGDNIVLSETTAFSLAPGCDQSVTSFSQNRWVPAPVKSQGRHLIKDVCLEQISVCSSLLELLSVLKVTEKGEYLPALPAINPQISRALVSPIAVGKDHVIAISCPYKWHIWHVCWHKHDLLGTYLHTEQLQESH